MLTHVEVWNEWEHKPLTQKRQQIDTAIRANFAQSMRLNKNSSPSLYCLWFIDDAASGSAVSNGRRSSDKPQRMWFEVDVVEDKVTYQTETKCYQLNTRVKGKK